jgi:hypothetical protein
LYPSASTFPSGGSGSGSGGYDWFYIYAANTSDGYGYAGTFDVQIAKVQREEGDYPTPFAPRSDELLPYSVGNTVLAPDSVTTQKIMANTIQAGDIAANTITATEIASHSITSNEIAAFTITSNEIAANSINATHLTADAIDGKTITGAIIRTGPTGTDRIVLGLTALTISNAANSLLFSLGPDGVRYYNNGTNTFKRLSWLDSAFVETGNVYAGTNDPGDSSAILARLESHGSVASGRSTGIAALYGESENNRQAFVMAKSSNTLSQAYAQAQSTAATIINDLGQSSFLQASKSNIQRIYWQPSFAYSGPLHIATWTITVQSNTQLWVFSNSAWAVAAGYAQVTWTTNGTLIASTEQYFNDAGKHGSFVDRWEITTYPRGTVVSLDFGLGGNTGLDSNDRVGFGLIELGKTM